jgi:hypothetical protein
VGAKLPGRKKKSISLCLRSLLVLCRSVRRISFCCDLFIIRRSFNLPHYNCNLFALVNNLTLLSMWQAGGGEGFGGAGHAGGGFFNASQDSPAGGGGDKPKVSSRLRVLSRS